MTFFSLLVTISSLGIAAISAGVAWRLARENQRRSDARVAALTAALDAGDVLEADVSQILEEHTPIPEASPTTVTTGLFSTAQQEPRDRRPITAALAGIGVLTAVAAVIALVLSVGSATAKVRPEQPAAAAQTPLQLTALESERDDRGLIVRGTVRNPDSASALTGLAAVVMLFNSAGDVVASERASVDNGELEPGHELPFSLRVANVPAADKYRVSFRSGDRIVPHVDRRHGS